MSSSELQAYAIKKQKDAEAWKSLSNSLKKIGDDAKAAAQQTNQLTQQMRQKNNYNYGNYSSGNKSKTAFYSPSDCYGSVINGKCIGTLKSGARPKYCHGAFINGQCNGAITDY
jgi:hypothetical protein